MSSIKEAVDSDKVSLEEQREQVDLVNNVNAKIQNPLYGIPKTKLFQQVEQFTREKGLEEHNALFRKAALLAQSPANFENIVDLDEADKAVIRQETTHKWKQPRDLYLTVVLCSIAAAVQGWDQTGSNGANLSFPLEFNITTDLSNPSHVANEWIVGLINSGPFISAALLGCWLTDPLNLWFGRRGTIFFCGIFCVFSVIGSAFAKTWPQLLVTRLLLGLGVGPKACTIPVFAAENTPANIRGGLVMSWQMWTAFGIFLGTAANLALFQTGANAWRLQLGSAFLPAVPLVLGVYFCPESPRWLMKKGRYHEAFASFKRLRNSELQAAKDLYYVHRQLMEEFAVLKGSTFVSRFGELFTVPRVRRATIASFVVMIAQQMCGINIISFYSSTIFVAANYSTKSALLASFGFGAINFLFAIPAVYTIDTFGRRNLLLFTFPNMAWTLLASGLCFLIDEGSPARIPLIVTFIYIFAAFYSPGEGPVPFVYAAEVFPLTHREMGMSWAVMINFLFASILGLTFPRILASLGPVGAFGLYSGFNVVAFIMIFFLLPETKQRTLEESLSPVKMLDYVFAVPLRRHVKYQGTTYLSYFIKRYIFFKKDVVLEPLYNFDEVESITVFEKGVGH